MYHLHKHQMLTNNFPFMKFAQRGQRTSPLSDYPYSGKNYILKSNLFIRRLEVKLKTSKQAIWCSLHVRICIQVTRLMKRRGSCLIPHSLVVSLLHKRVDWSVEPGRPCDKISLDLPLYFLNKLVKLQTHWNPILYDYARSSTYTLDLLYLPLDIQLLPLSTRAIGNHGTFEV